MKLTMEQLSAVALGAVRLEKTSAGVRFHRFSEAEDVLYAERDAALGRVFRERVLCPAGVKLSFKTDSRTLSISFEAEKRTSRSFFCFEVFVNGRPLGCIKNFDERTVPAGYTAAEIPFPLGYFEKDFALGGGEKRICIYFPALVGVKNFSLSLSNGASLVPVKPAKKLLMYGDSITQGFDALFPSRCLGAMLAEALDAEELNKAIGGEIFFPALAEQKADFSPDIITVAYGTNDWATTKGGDFLRNAGAFYTALCENYPEARIFAITPIYRKDMGQTKAFGTFSEVELRLRAAVEKLPAVTVIDGLSLLPHDYTLYADLRLHPADEGFSHYAKNLADAIKKAL